MNNVKKTSQGRQKIEIKKIETLSNLQVTFSKRRSGLFKKASELCILSGAEVAIIVKSPGKRTFAFGHPNADTIIDRFLSGTAAAANPVANNPALKEFNRQYAILSQQLEEEKRLSAVVIAGTAAVEDGKYWWQEKVDHLGLEELQLFLKALEDLKNNVAIRVENLKIAETAPALPPPEFYTSGGLEDMFTNPINQYGSLVPQGFDFAKN